MAFYNTPEGVATLRGSSTTFPFRENVFKIEVKKNSLPQEKRIGYNSGASFSPLSSGRATKSKGRR